MVEDKIRVGIVGAGNNTVRRHIPGLMAQEGVELVSVVNRSRASSQQVAERFGIPTVYDNWKALVTAPDSDAIVIGTWPYLHKPAAVTALEAGKHVLCEARMALNLAEARAMQEATQARPHLIAQLVPAPMTLEVDAFVASLLAEQALGDVLAVEVRDQQGFVDEEAPLHWRHDRVLSGLNVMSLGIWYVVMII
jgi:predicted dehydrogenase